MDYTRTSPPRPDTWVNTGGRSDLWNPVHWEAAKFRTADGRFQSEPCHLGNIKTSSLITVVLVECIDPEEGPYDVKDAEGLGKLLHFFGRDALYPLLNPNWTNPNDENGRLNVGIPIILNSDGWKRTTNELGSVCQPKSAYFALLTKFPMVKSLIFNYAVSSKDLPISEVMGHLEAKLIHGFFGGNKTVITNPWDERQVVKARVFGIPCHGVLDTMELIENLRQTLNWQSAKHQRDTTLAVDRGNPLLQKCYESDNILLTDYKKTKGVRSL